MGKSEFLSKVQCGLKRLQGGRLPPRSVYKDKPDADYRCVNVLRSSQYLRRRSGSYVQLQ